MTTMTCECCWEPIDFHESRTSTGSKWWHTRCFNQAEGARRECAAEREDCEGFTYRPLPDELPMSETGATRSEVFSSMATAAAAKTRAPREVVEFPPNIPITVALKYGHAKTVSSQYGERFMFSLVDGRVMFLAPEVGGRIESLGINARENFTITKKWDEQKGSPITWEVARMAGEQPNGTFVVPASKPPATATSPVNEGSRGRLSPSPSLV
jgi:hypothetical protein